MASRAPNGGGPEARFFVYAARRAALPALPQGWRPAGDQYREGSVIRGLRGPASGLGAARRAVRAAYAAAGIAIEKEQPACSQVAEPAAGVGGASESDSADAGAADARAAAAGAAGPGSAPAGGQAKGARSSPSTDLTAS